jgi:hypothetical protein
VSSPHKNVHFTALPALFFDLEEDPAEFRSLADDPAYQGLVLVRPEDAELAQEP